MEEQAVQSVGDPSNRSFADNRRHGDFAGPPLQGEWIVAGAFAGANRAGRKQEPMKPVHDVGKAALPDRDGFDHGHAKFLLEPSSVELQAVALRQVDHIQRDDGGQTEVDKLQGEAEVVVEVGCVDDDQQCLGQPLALLLAEQHIARDRLVGAGRVEAVGAGQINQLDRGSVGQGRLADVALDGDAGIIADFLTRAGQRVEQGAFPGIGVAGDRDQRNGDHAASGTTLTARAWDRRMATVIRPTRTASGSRPNGPR